jgi:hypothetical protein
MLLLLIMIMMMTVGFLICAWNSLIFKTANFAQELIYHVN